MVSNPECADRPATDIRSIREDYPPSRGRLRDAWNRWKHKNFAIAFVKWNQPMVFSRAQSRRDLGDKGVWSFLKAVLVMSAVLSLLVGVGVLKALSKGTLADFDWQTRLALLPLVSAGLLLFLTCVDWFVPKQIIFTHMRVVRQLGSFIERWNWEDIERAEIAQALFEGSQMRVLQLYLRKPRKDGLPVLLGLADKITDAELLCVFEAYGVPLTRTDQPPAGMERWQ